MRDLFTEVMAAVTTGAGAGPTQGNAGEMQHPSQCNCC
jgi:hypothetical protein